MNGREGRGTRRRQTAFKGRKAQTTKCPRNGKVSKSFQAKSKIKYQNILTITINFSLKSAN
jgi:hypothetical protein